jgi:hypothetical protein
MGRTGQAEQDRQNRKGIMRQAAGQAEQDWQNKTARIGLPRKNCQDRDTKTGLPG